MSRSCATLEFQTLTSGIILMNGLFIGIDADSRRTPERHLLTVPPFIFGAYIILERIIRINAFKAKKECLRDNWFKCDAFLVVMVIVDHIVASLSRHREETSHGRVTVLFKMGALLRLLWLGRLIRLLRSFQEITVMIRGIRAELQAMLSCMVLLLVITYIFGIALFILAKDFEMDAINDVFSTLPATMWVLLKRISTLDRWQAASTLAVSGTGDGVAT